MSQSRSQPQPQAQSQSQSHSRLSQIETETETERRVTKCQCAYKSHATDSTGDGSCKNDGTMIAAAYRETWVDNALVLICKPCSDKIVKKLKNPKEEACCCTFSGQWDGWAEAELVRKTSDSSRSGGQRVYQYP